jgi:hypothetical protein
MSKRAERLRTTKLSETHFRDTQILSRTLVLELFSFFDLYPLGSKNTPAFWELPEHLIQEKY